MEKRMRRGFTILCLIILLSILWSEPFEVLEKTPDYLIIKFSMPEYDIQEIEHNTEIYNKILCENSILRTNPGHPMLPYFSETIGLPVDGDYDLQVINSEHQVLNDINIYPFERIIQTGDSPENDIPEYVFYKNPDIYNNPGKYPERLLDKHKKAYVGDRYFAGFSINSFQFKPLTNELIITTELTFKINITGEKIESRSWMESSNFIDKIGDSFFLNNDFSKKWRKARDVTTYEAPRADEFVDEIQIIVNEEGIYRVSYDDMISALALYTEETEIEFEMGLNWNAIDPRYFELSSEFGTVPIHFVGESNNSFDPGDYFEFYGDMHYGDEKYYDDYTSENVYLLKYIDHFGSRMAVENGGLEITDDHLFHIPASFKQKIHFEEQNLRNPLGAQYDYLSDYGITEYYNEDIYFWAKIDAPNLEIFPFEIQYPHQSYIRTFDAEVGLFGSTYNADAAHFTEINHHAVVRINSSLINDHYWSDQAEKIFMNESSLTNDLLSHNTNYLYVSLPGIPNIANEQVLLEYLDLEYWREYKTDEDFIKFNRPQNRPFGLFQFELENFSSNDVSVYKIGSSIIENLQIESFYEFGGPPYKITFQDSVLSDGIEYFAVTEGTKKSPLKIVPNINPQLSSNSYSLKSHSNSADFIIITIPEFVNDEGTQLYKDIWINEGHTVEIVSLQDIFDEFNFGIRSAEAIKDFLTYAYNNWSSPQLSHVLFLGDGISDERDNSAARNYNIIPTKKYWVDTLGAIASENWYACIVGDDQVPDISIGRVNIWDREQIIEMANKSLHYLENKNFDDTWHSRAILAAGGKASDEEATFAYQEQRIAKTWIPEDFHINRVYTRLDDLPSDYSGNTATLKNFINEGAIFTQFIGHGGGYVWADYNLLTKSDIPTLNNDNYSFVSNLSCYGCAFNTPQSSCIGEEFIITPGRGAIASVGFTGYGYTASDEFVGKYLAEAIFDKKIENVGEILNFAKTKFHARFENALGNALIVRALVGGNALLGDPMINIVSPSERKTITLNKYNPTEGDVLIISSIVGSNITRGKFVIYDENDVQLPLTEYIPIEIPVINGILSTDNFNNFNVPIGIDSIYTRTVKLFGYGDNSEVTGITEFSVGRSAYANLIINPENPSYRDSIFVSADFFDENGIDSIECNVDVWNAYNDPFGGSNPIHSVIEMLYSDNNNYYISTFIPSQEPGYQVGISFNILDSGGETTTTSMHLIHILGSDLKIMDFALDENNNQPVAKALIKNIGTEISEQCNLKLYRTSPTELIDVRSIDPLDVMESRWDYVPLGLISDSLVFEMKVNEGEESFNEINDGNNTITSDTLAINMFFAGLDQTEASSLDNNFVCSIPNNLFSYNTLFYINNMDYLQPMNQPDTDKILLPTGSLSSAYQIGIFNESLLADSLGHFPANQTITLKFYYNPVDSLTQIMENQGNFNVYRWEDQFQKWIYKGGEIDVNNNFVVFETDQIGIYSIFQNNDLDPPQISVNVEGQEFEHTLPELGEGGYISHDGIISFLLSDANGIDIFDNDITLSLSDGLEINQIPEGDYAITIAQGHLTSIPIKYQLNLDDGDYLITIDCVDINGNYNTKTISFQVNSGLDIINIGNYPNPVSSLTEDPDNEGRTRFTYVLTDKLNIDNGDQLSLKIYTVSGRLVKTFDLSNHAGIGYHEFPRTPLGWDCRDEDGFYLANGTYFYRIVAKQGNKKIEKTRKMAILK